MKIFECQLCGQALYFENTVCPQCHHRLGFLPASRLLLALTPAPDVGEAMWRPIGDAGEPVRFCANAGHGVCNWLLPAASTEVFCTACRHNRTIPNLAGPNNRQRWQQMERAKHRLFYTLIELDLPLITRKEDPEEGLMFDFLEDRPDIKTIMTGHARGKITINIAEADDAERERRRTAMREPYRTLLGHFRHEIGHYFWNRLVRDTPAIDAFRALFGDERGNYRDALKRYYADGPPADWTTRAVSAYATSHPWEDFAETFAHYLHIVDTLDTAAEFGITVHPRHLRDADALSTSIDFEPQHASSVAPLIDAWLPLTFAVNNLNRSMGQNDFYPFVLSQVVIDKLGFVHDVVHGLAGRKARPQHPASMDAHLPMDEAPLPGS